MALSKLKCINVNVLKKPTLIYIFFIISFINSTLLIGWLASLLFWALFSKIEETKIEILLLLQLRSLINPGIAVTFSGMTSILKWIIILFVSALLFQYRNCEIDVYRRPIYKVFIIYSLYLIVSAWFVSSYPTVAIFKIISYVFPFLAIIKGVSDTYYIDWMKKLIAPLGILIISSIMLIPTSVGYLRNGYAFQGFFNHPNVFGVMLVLFLTGFLYVRKQFLLKEGIVVVIVAALLVMSGSRTSMISCVIGIVLFVLSKEIRTKSTSIVVIVFSIFILMIIILLNDSILNSINSLIFKGHSDSLLYSREAQFEKNLNRFYSSPYFGTGLNVPYIRGFRSLEFSFDLVVENGNLVLSLLGDTGILGILLFVISYGSILKVGINGMLMVFIIPFVVSMGEQSFFSTNNFGIYLYIFIAIYFANGIRQKKMVKDYQNINTDI